MTEKVKLITYIISIFISFGLGLFVNFLTSIYNEKLKSFFFDNKMMRYLFYWNSLYNTHHKKIYSCSLIQKCNLNEFSKITTKFVQYKYESIRYNILEKPPRCVIFNTFEPCDFADSILSEISEIGHAQKVEDLKSHFNSGSFDEAKEVLQKIKNLFISSEIDSFSHVYKIDRFFKDKYRIQFFYFPLTNAEKIIEFKERNDLYKFIIYKELINDNVKCYWTQGDFGNKKVGINGIIIDDRYLFDYNDKACNLFFARNGFLKYNDLEEEIQPHYNKYLNMVYNNPKVNSKMINIDIIGQCIYGTQYTNYYGLEG